MKRQFIVPLLATMLLLAGCTEPVETDGAAAVSPPPRQSQSTPLARAPTAVPSPTALQPTKTAAATATAVPPTPTMPSTPTPTALPQPSPWLGPIARVNVAQDGSQASRFGSGAAISGDGRFVTFVSDAHNLVATDAPDDCRDFEGMPASCADVFVFDRETGHLERVTVANDGTPGNADSGVLYEQGSYSAISADGVTVAFHSFADNLVPGIPSGNLYVADRATKTIEVISVSPDGLPGDQLSSKPALSADGRFVAFGSEATNLVVDDTNEAADIFVYDRQTKEMERVSVAADGSQANHISGAGFSPSLSADGRYVVFVSFATNLVPDDTNEMPDVFLYDRQTKQPERISLAGDGTQATYAEGVFPAFMSAVISADGCCIAFDSEANNLVDNDTNEMMDVFVYDRNQGQMERVSISSNGEPANGASWVPTISGDGRWVVFMSEAGNLVAADSNETADIFIHDRVTGRTERVSTTHDGMESNDWSAVPALSADGQWVVFQSRAHNLVPDDTNQVQDIFIRALLFAHR